MSVLHFQNARRLVEEHAARIQPGAPPLPLTPGAAEAAAQQLGTEVVPLLSAVGRALAEDVVAARDLPPFRRATRDGFAVRAGDAAQVPATLRVVGQIRAGADA